MLKETREARGLLLGGALPSATGEGVQISDLSSSGTAPTIQSLERYAPSWSRLVPDDDMSRIGLVRALAQKYEFAPGEIPNIRQALHLDERSVQQSYEATYGRPLSDVWVHGAATAKGKQQRPVKPSDNNSALHAILDELTWTSLRKGDTLMREGDVAD